VPSPKDTLEIKLRLILGDGRGVKLTHVGCWQALGILEIAGLGVIVLELNNEKYGGGTR
jgi:hypothetical protein